MPECLQHTMIYPKGSKMDMDKKDSWKPLLGSLFGLFRFGISSLRLGLRRALVGRLRTIGAGRLALLIELFRVPPEQHAGK